MGKLLIIRIIECVVYVYDIISLPLYYLVQQPWKVEQTATRIRAIQVEPNTWVNVDSKLVNESKSALTLDQLFRDSVSTYADKECLGVRKILHVEYKTDASGSQKKKQILKYDLDDKFTWSTYREIGQTVSKVSAGLTSICNDSILNSDGSRKILICADTCIQWFLFAHACFRNNITVVTAYTTLDDDTIISTLNETEVKILVVSQIMAQRIPRILDKAPIVDTIIILDQTSPGQEDEKNNLKSLITENKIKRLIAYQDLMIHGGDIEEKITNVPTKDDVAVLMYTSGSSGKAKAVMLTHHSIVYTSLSFSGPGNIDQNDRYIGYLPLGHVLELAAECIFLRNGSTIAFSSPYTLTDHSPYVKRGQSGDLTLFKPTIMGSVPLVLDRVKNALQQAIKSQGPFYDQLINDFVIRYKRYWWERYYETPIMNFLICRKFKNILGGHMRAICSGGAALSKETQEYLRHVTNTIVIQGYGLTETSAAASFSDIDDRRYNTVGPPYPSVQLKLESWSDYSVDDKPYPRGEVIIGGQPVSAGYYKMPELTAEYFYTDSRTGMRYFRTGDIGLMLPDGVLKIVDRKKDIVKPLSGEYISLSAIESALNGEALVENILVYCSQYSNYIIAIVRPNAKELKLLASKLYKTDKSEAGDQFRQFIDESIKKVVQNDKDAASADGDTNTSLISDKSHIPANGKDDNTNGNGNGSHTNGELFKMIDKISIQNLCSNKHLANACVKLLQEAGSKNKLKRTQLPSKVKLASEEWTQESGLVTASFKLRRRDIERFYSSDIKHLYAELGQKIDQDNSS